jgi:pyridoxine/pyridoxamine 5'-phosphate oxidase
MSNRPLHADDLDACLAEAFQLFAGGVSDRRSAFRTPTLATIAIDGTPSARVVVLRGFDAAQRVARIHTDARSSKVAELAREPRVALTGYDAAAKVQIRLSGIASVHADDETADAAWTASAPMSRACYAIGTAPGTPVEAPLAAPRDPDAGRPHFRAVLIAFDRVEWLWLAMEGHRRARFDWSSGALVASWLAP